MISPIKRGNHSLPFAALAQIDVYLRVILLLHNETHPRYAMTNRVLWL
jgi:hypothetical protein